MEDDVFVQHEVFRWRAKVHEAVVASAEAFRVGAIGTAMAKAVVTKLEREILRAARLRADIIRKAVESTPEPTPRPLVLPTGRRLRARPAEMVVPAVRAMPALRLYARLSEAGLHPEWKVSGFREGPPAWRVVVSVANPAKEEMAFVVFRVNSATGNLNISEFYRHEAGSEPRRFSSWAIWREMVFGWAQGKE